MFRLAVLRVLTVPLLITASANAAEPPLGASGQSATYTLNRSAPSEASMVATLRVTIGPLDSWNGSDGQWLSLHATKRNQQTLRLWMLCARRPAPTVSGAQTDVLRYILQEGDMPPAEYRHGVTLQPVLPQSGAWSHLFPRGSSGLLAETVEYLGHTYHRGEIAEGAFDAPAEPQLHLLRPDVLTGIPHNTRQADETRRFDDSEYDYIPLTTEDFQALVDTGINCIRATPENVDWLEEQGVFYWGIGPADLPYPECLYRPLYIGPALFLNEPAVVTRDHDIRPRLREDPEFRRSITPQAVMAYFEKHYANDIENGPPQQLIRGLAAREDVNLGGMNFVQPNIYSWETMVSSAAHQLLYNAETPNAIVFEPPGQLGLRRTVPAWNMAYGCQIPITGRDHFMDVIIGFLRGAARASGKQWGISVYGGVDRTEAPAFLARAYELGATRFFYWDSARLACVPFGEVLGHTRHLQYLATQYPERDLEGLRNAAEVAILFPPGYNLGHVWMGKGLLWGVTELNLERTNNTGVQYRTVMGNLFTEVERCLRLGVAFDLLWDLPTLEPAGYREVVRIREDGQVDVHSGGETETLAGPRVPERPSGAAPSLAVSLPETAPEAPCTIMATATIAQGSAPVYYAPRPDAAGVHRPMQVLWELYGPNDEDYVHWTPAIQPEPATVLAEGPIEARVAITIEEPGRYRLRAATTDLAGRTAVSWTELEVRAP